MRLKRGALIAFEGGEGSGKSTQIERAAEHFKACGVPVVATREPGGTPIAEKIRGLIFDAKGASELTELLLFMAARMEHLETCILPAVAEHKIVLTDRFDMSNWMYQIAGRGAYHLVPLFEQLRAQYIGKIVPTYLVFDIDPADGLARVRARRGEITHFDERDLGFHRGVRAGMFEFEIQHPGPSYYHIDATPSADDVAEAVGVALEAIVSGLR